jgi:hypothetical protein
MVSAASSAFAAGWAPGLGRALPPDAAPAAIGSAVTDLLGDDALRAASRSFASGVSRFSDLTRRT